MVFDRVVYDAGDRGVSMRIIKGVSVVGMEKYLTLQLL